MSRFVAALVLGFIALSALGLLSTQLPDEWRGLFVIVGIPLVLIAALLVLRWRRLHA